MFDCEDEDLLAMDVTRQALQDVIGTVRCAIHGPVLAIVRVERMSFDRIEITADPSCGCMAAHEDASKALGAIELL